MTAEAIGTALLLAAIVSEFIATFGLLAVIWGCARLRSSAVPFAVAAYITGTYWFTASTSLKPCRKAGPVSKRYFCRNPARRRAGVCRGAISRRSGGDGTVKGEPILLVRRLLTTSAMILFLQARGLSVRALVRRSCHRRRSDSHR